MWIRLRPLLAGGTILPLLLAACDGSGHPEAGVPEPQSEPPAVVASAPTSLSEIFPEGLGRALVIESCGGCHAVACSAIGQRTTGRWKALEADHRDRVADMGDEDYAALFAYLSENFNDSKPEPSIPPQFLAGGCTPF